MTREHWDAVVIGTGMIGLFVIQTLRLRGCGKIIAVDLDDNKLNLACQLGADVGLNARSNEVQDTILAETSGRGADIAVEVEKRIPQPAGLSPV